MLVNGLPYTLETAKAVLAEKTERRGGCLEWIGRRDSFGYGRMKAFGQDRAHRVAFVVANGPLPKGARVRHRCDNPPCCEPQHLLHGTPAENSRDMVERGRSAKQHGETNGFAKLTAEKVREIRTRFASGETQTAIAVDTGVDQAHISRLVRRKAWAHL